MEALTSESHESSISSISSAHEEDGFCYKRKRKLASNPCCCPACGVTVRPGEWTVHYAQELERVCKLKLRHLSKTIPSEQSHSGMSSKINDTDKRWRTYLRVKGNRQMRLRVKNRKQSGSEVTCPVCNKSIQGTAEELNQHVEGCLNQQISTAEDEEVDVEGNGETFEEYEWAGQHRIRATSLIPGGFAALGMATSRSTKCSDHEEEEKVIVDVDDSVTYGAPQYAEADIVTVSADESGEISGREAIRNALTNTSRNAPSATEENSCATDEPVESLQNRTVKGITAEEDFNDSGQVEQNPVVEVLKTKIKRLECEIQCGSEKKFVCLICMDNYKKPVVSISCWHVHCEDCWLHTLGAKKLCPQCNMITSPTDLRRIYL